VDQSPPSVGSDQYGHYALGEVLGEGGMGVVYRAEQSEPVQRTVALKVIKLGMDTERVIARFRAEQQSLAVMDHPSIARVYDAGVSERGRPYFVMELVDGTSMTTYADAHSLTVSERLEVFIQACNAVQHAHQKGIIHRDLKPSNVLVTESDGRPLAKVIDFSIARATQAAEEDHRLTMANEMVGTPAYMSPEQIEGSEFDIDTRADIYALGVILYELLAGMLPFENAAYKGWAAFATTLTRDAPTLSRRLDDLDDTQETVARERGTSVVLLRRRLRGDLQWIVAKAMEKDRDRRYASASALVADLERHLAHIPVTARAPTTAYRMGSFVRRHRLGTAFAVSVVGLLVAFGVGQTIQAERVRAARDVAEARRGQAEGLIDFMLGDLRAKLADLGRLDVLDDVGNEALEYFSALPPEEFSDDELLTRSQALYQIGSVRLNQGNPTEALPVLEESLRLVRALTDRDPEDTERLFGLSQSHFWVGYAAWLHGDLDAAELEFDGYMEAATRLVALDSTSLDFRMELGYAHSNLGSVREARGDFEGAVEAFSRTLEVKQDLVARDPDRVDWLGELAETHNTLAVAYRKLGEYDRAREEHRTELALKLDLIARSPTEAYWQSRLGMAYSFLAHLELDTGDNEAALGNARTAQAILDSLSATDPTNAIRSSNVAKSSRQVGIIAARLGQSGEARAALDAAVRRMEGLVESDSTAFEWRMDLAMIRTDRARAMLTLGQPTEALSEVRRAREMLAEATTSELALLEAWARNDLVLGHALAQTGDAVAAREAWGRAVQSLSEQSDEAGFSELRPILAEAYLMLDRLDEATRELAPLVGRGYRETYLMDLAAAKGVAP